VLTRLSDNQGSVNAIWVSGSDVYAVGYEYLGGGIVARIWKNGVGTFLTNNGSDANSLFISGNDIYIGGYESDGIKAIPKIWKNGVPTILANNDKAASVMSIYVLGSIVYSTMIWATILQMRSQKFYRLYGSLNQLKRILFQVLIIF